MCAVLRMTDVSVLNFIGWGGREREKQRLICSFDTCSMCALHELFHMARLKVQLIASKVSNRGKPFCVHLCVWYALPSPLPVLLLSLPQPLLFAPFCFCCSVHLSSVQFNSLTLRCTQFLKQNHLTRHMWFVLNSGENIIFRRHARTVFSLSLPPSFALLLLWWFVVVHSVCFFFFVCFVSIRLFLQISFHKFNLTLKWMKRLARATEWDRARANNAYEHFNTVQIKMMQAIKISRNIKTYQRGD